MNRRGKRRSRNKTEYEIMESIDQPRSKLFWNPVRSLIPITPGVLSSGSRLDVGVQTICPVASGEEGRKIAGVDSSLSSLYFYLLYQKAKSQWALWIQQNTAQSTIYLFFFSLASTLRISPSSALGDGDIVMIRDSLVVPLCITARGLGLVSASGSSFCGGGADGAAGSGCFFSSFSVFSASASCSYNQNVKCFPMLQNEFRKKILYILW